MSNSNLASLPPSMLQNILSKVTTSHLWDCGSARVAFSGFNQVAREEYFYRSADIFHLNGLIDEAIYTRGTYEFFVLYLLDEGRDKIYLAGERGLLLAKYVDDMLNLAFSIDDRGLMITTLIFSGQWTYEKSEIFMSLLERIDSNVSHDCWCSKIIEPVFVVFLDGSRTRWRFDHCFQ
ncbi:hypothetical protein N665_0966s0002 [Sinapis alba]|nr:hypothetical protein N665_0966s0002 [Sinapis alba]